MPLGDSKAEKEKTTEDLETSCSQDRPGPQEPPGGQGSWEEHSICRSLGRASCHPSSRVEGQHSPLDHHKGSAPTPSLSPVYAPPCLPPPGILLCQQSWAAPQLQCGKNPQWPRGRYAEQALGYRCNLPPRNVPCSNHFLKLHKHNLCTVINYLAENDALC